MKADLLAPFTNAACQTFKLLLDVDALAEAAQGEDGESDQSNRVHVAIGITGDLTGEVLYRFPEDTTLEIVKTMSGMEFSEIDEFVTSALGEIANIISGNAVTDLSEMEIVCDIMPPEILGDGTQARSDETTTYAFTAKVNTSIGDIEVLLKLQS